MLCSLWVSGYYCPLLDTIGHCRGGGVDYPPILPKVWRILSIFTWLLHFCKIHNGNPRSLVLIRPIMYTSVPIYHSIDRLHNMFHRIFLQYPGYHSWQRYNSDFRNPLLLHFASIETSSTFFLGYVLHLSFSYSCLMFHSANICRKAVSIWSSFR